MSRTPVLDSTVAKMAQLALESGESLPPDITPDQAATAYLIGYTENGGRLSRLAQTLGVSRFLLQRWIWGDEERKQAYARARTEGSHALVDEGGDLLDSATRDTIAVANARAGWRKWLAGKYDPQSYGDSQAPQVSIGSLHLHALQSPRPLPLLDTKPPPVGSPESVGERGYPTEGKALSPGVTIHEAPPSSDLEG